MTTQETFNPVNYGFRWTEDEECSTCLGSGRLMNNDGEEKRKCLDCRGSGEELGWYEFDQPNAAAAARNARDERVRELEAAGHIVRKMRPVKSLITQGGIGTSHPQIELMVPVYSLLIVA